MYHSVAKPDAAPWIEPGNRVDPRTFERQMAYLAAERRVVSLSELVDTIADGRALAADTVCITFDDCYRDNLTVAAPILERYRLPATLFLATGRTRSAGKTFTGNCSRQAMPSGCACSMKLSPPKRRRA